jgi:hypothetical protein
MFLNFLPLILNSLHPFHIPRSEFLNALRDLYATVTLSVIFSMKLFYISFLPAHTIISIATRCTMALPLMPANRKLCPHQASLSHAFEGGFCH